MQGKRGSNQSEHNLAMLGHELCSVLNGIQGMTELLDGTRLNGEQKQFVEAVKLSIRQMQWLVGSTRSSTVRCFRLLLNPVCSMDRHCWSRLFVVIPGRR